MSNIVVTPSQDVTASSITSFHVSTYVYDPAVIELAKDYVKGQNTDYYFFQYDSDEYVLILSDDMQSAEHFDCSASDCICIVFWRYDSLSQDSESISLSGTITEAGASPSVDSVTLSGSVSDYSIYSVYRQVVVPVDSLHVYNSEYCCYSSVSPYCGKLVEGVSYYAYAGFVLAAGIIAFRLADRFFRRIY